MVVLCRLMVFLNAEPAAGMNKLFSVITPSFNQGDFLEETILSVRNQDYPFIEHIVIDGGSTDQSVSILEKHSEKLSYWISEKDKGQSDAINKGLKHATGDYIMWLNSDDVLLPGALKKAAECFANHPGVDMIHGKAILFGNHKKERIIGKKQEDLPFKYLAYIPFPQPASFFTKRLIEQTGLLDEQLHYAMDYELLVRAKLKSEVMFCDHLFSKYRLHSESKTHQHMLFAKEWNLVFSRFLNSISNNEQFVSLFKKYNLFQPTEIRYTHEKNFSESDIRKVSFYHAYVQLHQYYEEKQLSRCVELAGLCKALSPELYRTYKVGYIRNKSRLLNPGILSLFRRLTRS